MMHLTLCSMKKSINLKDQNLKSNLKLSKTKQKVVLRLVKDQRRMSRIEIQQAKLSSPNQREFC